MKKKFVILFVIVLITIGSCYNHKIILNSNKNSGSMIIEYDLNDEYFQLLSIAVENFGNGDEEQQFDPMILIDEDYFKENFKSTKDLKLKSVKITATDDSYEGKIIIDFYDLDSLLKQLPKDLVNLEVIKEKGTLTLSQEIDYNQIDPDGVFKDFIQQQKEDNAGLYNMLMNDAKFSFVLESSVPVKKVVGVNLSKDKKRASYTFKISDIINNTKKLKFLISL